MHRIILLLCGGVMAAAQSHPGWWTFADPESKSLIGVKWSALRDSPSGETLRAVFAADGPVPLPGLACLLNSRDFLIASPPVVIGASAGCSVAEVRAQAGALGMKRIAYKGIDLWIAPEKSAVSLAQWNERVVLIGARRSLQEAIDRSQAESRTYCPLLISAAKQSKLQDVWVVGSEDADTVAVNFALIAERIEQDKLSAPPGATALPIRLVSAIPVSAEEAREERPKVEPAKSPEIAKAEAPKPVEAKTVDAKPEPRVIRIYGLDGGTREIVLPPKEPQSN